MLHSDKLQHLHLPVTVDKTFTFDLHKPRQLVAFLLPVATEFFLSTSLINLQFCDIILKAYT